MKIAQYSYLLMIYNVKMLIIHFKYSIEITKMFIESIHKLLNPTNNYDKSILNNKYKISCPKIDISLFL